MPIKKRPTGTQPRRRSEVAVLNASGAVKQRSYASMSYFTHLGTAKGDATLFVQARSTF
jgi:hypothetical protein